MDLASLQERKELIDKVASDVAEQGPALEARLRAEQGNNPLYSFLNPYCQPQDGNHYYRHKLQLEVMLEDYREQLLSRSGLQITIFLSLFLFGLLFELSVLIIYFREFCLYEVAGPVFIVAGSGPVDSIFKKRFPDSKAENA
jgi:hypothetical protein